MHKTMTKHLLAAMWLLWALGATAPNRLPLAPFAGVTLLAQQPAPIEEFVPIDELPPQDQLPAAPLLVGAYSSPRWRSSPTWGPWRAGSAACSVTSNGCRQT
jgi:hypothetical protein